GAHASRGSRADTARRAVERADDRDERVVLGTRIDRGLADQTIFQSGDEVGDGRARIGRARGDELVDEVARDPRWPSAHRLVVLPHEARLEIETAEARFAVAQEHADAALERHFGRRIDATLLAVTFVRFAARAEARARALHLTARVVVAAGIAVIGELR